MPEGLQRLWRTFFDIDQIMAILPELLAVGVPNTIILALVAVVIGSIIGLVVAMMLISRSAIVRMPARTVDVFRGLPVILTIYLVGQGLDRGHPHFRRKQLRLCRLAFGLIEGAYISEIFRSGIQSVERGQMEASRSLGLILRNHAMGHRSAGHQACPAGPDRSVHPHHQGLARLSSRIASGPARDLQHCVGCIAHLGNAVAYGGCRHRLSLPSPFR